MKRIFKYTFVGLLAGSMLMTTSCSEDSLITSPTQSMSGEGLLATGNAALVALNGIYREMYTAGWSTTGNTHQCFGITAYNLASEVMGEDFIMGAMGSGWFWFDCIYDVKDMYTRTTWRNYDLWNAYYNWIANANYIIAAEETMGGSTVEKNYAIGQAYAIRAYSYFMLAQWYARTLVGHESEACVPIYTEPTTPETKGNPRSTNAEVYAQIDSDIDKACELLEGTEDKRKELGIKSHIGYPVALGLKARIRLVENKWAEARDAAKAAINASGCTIQPVANFIGMNNVNANNVMWGAEVITDQVGMYASFYSHMDYEGGKSYAQSAPKLWNKELYAKMEPTDERRQWVKTGFTYKDQDGVATSGLLQEKFHFSDPQTWMGDYIFMRVEEMYLIAAEAECRLGSDAAAQEDLMALMSKRNPDYVCDKTGTALGKTSAVAEETGSLLEEIIIQRRIELWGEAGRMYDLKRLKQGFRRTTAQGWCESALLANRPTDNPNNYMWVMTIPQTEFDGNSSLDASKDQNPLGDE
ncbi:MAG: RagB/SusD family nutrient uptake outer membrane protein [Prevotella sp.]|nr:RagB/SusD family nutrient uptake outer membrane protein [Prevotella sp.]